MKVNIGPYIDEGERIVDIHIDKYDTWSMDDTLAHIILPMLKQLKETKHGSPNVDSGDVPPELRCNDVSSKAYWTNGETDEKFHDRWDYVMDEMIYAFQAKIGDDPDFFFEDDEPQYEITKIEWKGIGPCQLRLFPDETGSMEDYELYEWVSGARGRFDKEAHAAYHERIQNGFRLFGKYYESLWD